jgi:predicted nuclease with TOPRIM domain
MTMSKCTCGSGAHPRYCLAHPEDYDKHVDTLTKESLYDDNARLTAENDALRARVAELERARDQLVGDLQAVSADYTQVRARVAELEGLLREAWVHSDVRAAVGDWAARYHAALTPKGGET